MIIKSLRASNFMKFQSIDLNDLPEQGEIAVIGENESGKTTLGECIAFAIFGRTVRTEETDPAQVINWASDDCETAITLKVANKGNFRIERMVSRGGVLSAKLFGPDGSVLAEDLASVNLMLPRLLGFNFPEFRYSFYVAQKEIDIIRHARRDNTRQIVHDMLGITAVDRARALAETECQEILQKSETLDRDLAVAKALRTSIALDDDVIRRYEQEKIAIEDAIGTALASEKQCRGELDRQRALGAARREVLSAWEAFQRSFLHNHHRERLKSLIPSIRAVTQLAADTAEDINKSLMRDEKSYNHALQKLEKLRASAILVRELKALASSRQAALSNELSERDPEREGWTPQSKAEYRVFHQRRGAALASAAGRGASIVQLLLALAGLGVGGAMFAEQIPISEGSLPLEMTPAQLAVFLIALGAVLLLGAIFAFLRGSKAKVELAANNEALEKLDRVLEEVRRENTALGAFSVDRLADLGGQVRRINNATISAKFDELRSQAGDSLEVQSSVDELLASEAAKEKSLREGRDKLYPKLTLAGRLRRLGEESEARIAKALGGDAKAEGAVDPSFAEALQTKNLEALEDKLEGAMARATSSVLTLESMAAEVEGLARFKDASSHMLAALENHFRLSSEGESQKARFNKESQIPSLIEGAKSSETDSVRTGLGQEGKLLGELLGREDALKKAIDEAEARLREIQERRSAAETRRAGFQARSENYREQKGRAEELMIKIAGLENALAPMKREVAVRRELVKLYAETIDGMKARFGPNISRYIELLLPAITRNRYRKVQITTDLDIKVYSAERTDFVRLIDLSYGTSDQILLALRLGLAQALVHSRGITNGEQFMYLDEPLEAFDESRSQAFLNLMRTFDDNFAQIFVSSTRGLEHQFEKIITLEAKNHELLSAKA